MRVYLLTYFTNFAPVLDSRNTVLHSAQTTPPAPPLFGYLDLRLLIKSVLVKTKGGTIGTV